VSNFSFFVLLALFLVAALVAAYLMMNRPTWKPTRQLSRIKILGKDKIIIRAAAARNCPACKKVLAEGVVTAKCSMNPAHEIHKACKVLVNGKCPQCGHALV